MVIKDKQSKDKRKAHSHTQAIQADISQNLRRPQLFLHIVTCAQARHDLDLERYVESVA